MENLCFVPSRVMMLGHKMPVYEHVNNEYDLFRQSGNSDLTYIDELATHRGVKANRENVQISVDKCDVPYKCPNDALQDYVFKLLADWMEPVLTTTTMRPDDEFEYKSKASPSKFWKLLGCKTKADAFAHPLFLFYVSTTDHLPVDDVASKFELLDLIEILVEKKIRTTFTSQADFVMKENLCFLRQDANIKEVNDEYWIQYGCVKQYGGFNRVGKRLEPFDFKDEDDVQGYDRRIGLELAMRLRFKFLKYPPSMYAIIEYVIVFTLFAFIACPDGVIRMRKTGNCSGRKMTTTNNSLAHLFILFRFICKLWLNVSRFKRLPTLKEILECHLYLVYSDDNTGGHKLQYLEVFPDEFLKLKNETYAEFGMSLKPKQHFSSSGLGRINPRHSFLGSSFSYSEDFSQYIPFPRLNAIASTLKYDLKKLAPIDLFSKVYALLLLSVLDQGLFSELLRFMNFLQQRYPHTYSTVSPELRALTKGSDFVSMQNRFMLVLLGKESGGGCLFPWMEVGVKKMNKVERGNKMLDRIAQRVGLTEEGKEWLIAALDPMHDEKLKCRGYPDREVGPSVVQVIKQSVAISNPYTDGATGAVWGFHLTLDDMMASSSCRNRRAFGNRIDPSTTDSVSLPCGGVNVTGIRGTAPIWQFPDTATDATNRSIAYLTVPSEYLEGKSRVLSQGVEVVNTTAELYRGGSLAVYQQPGSKSDHSTHLIRGAQASLEMKSYWENKGYEVEIVYDNPVEEICDKGPVVRLTDDRGLTKWTPKGKSTYLKLFKKIDGKRVEVPTSGVGAPLATDYMSFCSVRWESLPPNSLADAMLLCGSKQWDAAKGCYIVQTMNDMENPASPPDYVSTAFNDPSVHPVIANSLIVPTNDLSNSAYFDPYFGFINAWTLENASEELDQLLFVTHANKRIPFDRKGVIVTGLTPQSTFTINYNSVIERFLSSSERDLVVLAQPSPCEDLKAMALYSLIARDLPVGVEFTQNDFGDWFLGICDEVANVVSTVGKPIMGAIDSYQQSRQNPTQKVQQSASTYSSNPTTSAMMAQPQLKRKLATSKKGGKKSGRKATDFVSGPTLPNGKFKAKNANK